MWLRRGPNWRESLSAASRKDDKGALRLQAAAKRSAVGNVKKLLQQVFSLLKACLDADFVVAARRPGDGSTTYNVIT